jgi:L-iditol 2-dehydrogenase
MKSEALWYLGDRRLEMRAVEIPEPGYDEVIVETEACGICTWDIMAYLGRMARYYTYPFCAGHEGIGRIVKAGPRVKGLSVGQRVVMLEQPVGGQGAAEMARHVLRAERHVCPVPEGPLPLEHWIVEPAVCIVNGTVHAGIQPGDRVALVGVGYMGLLFVQALARTLAASIVAFDIDERRLALSKELGATETRSLSGGTPKGLEKSFDVVIETAGAAAALKTAFELTRPGGIIQNFAWHHHEHTFDLEDWHVNGWRINNIQPGMNPHFADLYPGTIALMATGAISNARLVTHVGPVGKAAEVFRVGADKTDGYIKGVITF